MAANDPKDPRNPTPLPWRFEMIRMDRINVPSEALRRHELVPESVDAELRASIDEHGLLVPIKVRPLGRPEFSLIDGGRRLAACKALGWSGATELPAIVTLGGGDEQDVIEQIHVNQHRARLDPVAEAEGLRRLVEDKGWSQRKAALALGKTEAWASQIMAVWGLPEQIIRDMRAGRFGLTQALVLARHREDSALLDYLHGEALEGRSVRELEAKAKRLAAVDDDPAGTGRRFDVRQGRIGVRSRYRIETGKRSRRLEVTLDEDDDWEEILAIVQREVGKLRPPRSVAPAE